MIADTIFASRMPRDADAVAEARGWLRLATLAVAAAALFAILLVLARVPAIGALLPGRGFYRVALTQHVVLAQWIWFGTLAATLWSLAAGRRGRMAGRGALAACALGTLMMTAAPAAGVAEPLMSNYLPVLDSPWFLAGLATFSGGLAVQAVRGLSASVDGPTGLGLKIAAAATLLVFAMLPPTAVQLAGQDGRGYYEALFWGSGHVWQFALTALMMIAWARLGGADRSSAAVKSLPYLLVIGALPLAQAVWLQIRFPAMSAAYRHGFTEMMRYTSWEAPLVLGLVMIALGCRHRDDWAVTVFRLSFGIFLAGLLIGSTITDQTTLVTAHYHGTIGAVTLALMGCTYALLPALGLNCPNRRAMRIQAYLYGCGNLLMMAGLAGAGWMGAPRKEAGNVALDPGIEMFSRIVMGVGGSLALAGIVIYFALASRSLGAAAAMPAPVVAAR